MVAVRLVVWGCFHSTTLRRRLDNNADVRTCSRPRHACLAEPDFLPFCVRVRLREPNDVLGLCIDSEYVSRPHFTKLEQGSKVAATLQALIRVSSIL